MAGREGSLKDAVGVTHALPQSPHITPLIQSGIAVVVLGLFAFLRLDPVLALFT